MAFARPYGFEINFARNPIPGSAASFFINNGWNVFENNNESLLFSKTFHPFLNSKLSEENVSSLRMSSIPTRDNFLVFQKESDSNVTIFFWSPIKWLWPTYVVQPIVKKNKYGRSMAIPTS